MIKNDEFMAKSGVVNYYSKWLGKYVSKIEKSEKNPENKFNIFFRIVMSSGSYFDQFHKISASDKVSCVSYWSFSEI